MSLKQFEEIVLKDEGYILSDGTLNLVHLLPKAYDFLVNHELNEKLRDEILEVFEFDVEFKKDYHSLFLSQYYGEARINEDKNDEANYLWNEDVYNYFSSISPDGYYFGGSIGDGALIGWFKYDEEEI